MTLETVVNRLIATLFCSIRARGVHNDELAFAAARELTDVMLRRTHLNARVDNSTFSDLVTLGKELWTQIH